MDESTCLPANEALLLAYVRFVMGEEIHKELLFAKTLKTDTKDIAHLTDLFKKFNDLNLQLQGDSLNLIKTKSVISAFFGKLKFMKENIGRHEFSQFSNLSQVECLDEDIQTYVQYLIALHDDFKFRFEDILSTEIRLWIINPFDETEVENLILQEELLELSTYEELKVTLKRGYRKFWLQAEIPQKYPGLWRFVQKLLIAFPSSHPVEKSFSAVKNLLTKKRSRLSITERGDLVIPYKTQAKY
ncbi:SCAN domain-containing protein 3 [Eumeta japonica]|uniref:SCAN domain-containing protein 3 n=1 Tax=Eumeta variegata TaxID=151549 RepID=A0A4C1SQ14_EUMVA|nr:SCAN domain-containing protein 3 [Eumeta japonica]